MKHLTLREFKEFVAFCEEEGLSEDTVITDMESNELSICLAVSDDPPTLRLSRGDGALLR